MNFRMLGTVILAVSLATLSPLYAQQETVSGGIAPQSDVEPPVANPSGASTLEDILRRQAGEDVPRPDRPEQGSSSAAATEIFGALGTLGATSDAEVWEELRMGTADITTTSHNPGSNVIMQDGGMWWLQFRSGPLRTYGGYLLLGTLVLLLLFYLIRGKIRIEGQPAGINIERFKPIERFGHWLLAGSFIVLGITGLISLFGRVAVIPLLGKEAYAPIALGSKWVHNNVSWAFMIGLVMVFVMWVFHNFPNRYDIVWLLKGGGLFSKHSHPPAKKFNAGQKIIFWAVILLGASISASGLSLLFPFELPMFSHTFTIVNDLGLANLFLGHDISENLTPHQEMQYSQLWHAIVSFVLMAVILAHIYIGTIGMEGAFEAMGSGEVDLQWAKEHHSIWVEEELEKAKAATPPPSSASATPAE
jgi:formate dehydrogenase subunit gamma